MKETTMTDKQRAAKVLELLAERYPDLETHLIAESPWELLVATVLAAQCTDERVNKVTPALFARWPGPAETARAPVAEVEEYVRTGDPMDKAGAYGIQSGAAHMIREIHGSYTNVVGMPMTELFEALQALGVC